MEAINIKKKKTANERKKNERKKIKNKIVLNDQLVNFKLELTHLQSMGVCLYVCFNDFKFVFHYNSLFNY